MKLAAAKKPVLENSTENKWARMATTRRDKNATPARKALRYGGWVAFDMSKVIEATKWKA